MKASADTVSLEEFLAHHAGLDADGVAELRARLGATPLWLGCKGLLQFNPHILLNSVTSERRRARAMLQTEVARENFDSLIEEGFAVIPFDPKAKRAVICMAHLIAMLRDLCALQELRGPLRVEVMLE
ncbi:MAG: hypothetical protein WBX25_30445 [Rhodomicrobium sp.]